MVKTKKLVYIAVLLSAALVLHILESFLPPFVPLPGIKPGLANAVTLFAVIKLDRRSAFAVLLMRIVIGSFFFGNVFAFIYSLCGGMLSFAGVACLLKPFKRNVVFLSVVSAILHNIGQVSAAVLLTKTPLVFMYLAPLTVSAVICGVFTGAVSYFVLKNFTQI